MARSAGFFLWLVCAAAIGAVSLGAVVARGRAEATTAVTVRVKEWEFALSRDSFPVGSVEFTVINEGVFRHDFSILGKTTPPLRSGQSATLVVTFREPGVYGYGSTVDDVDYEMWGSVTVTGDPLPPTATRAPSSALPLKRVAAVSLPGGSSRFDYQSIDPRRKRLYIAHLGADSVVVFDLSRRRALAEVGGLSGVHGVLAVPALGRVYATATDDRELVVIGAGSLKIAARAAAGAFPDGLAYDPRRARVFVSDKTGGSLVVADRNGSVLRKIPVGGEPGNVQYDPVTGRMLVAVGGREQLVAVAPTGARVAARYALPGCAGAHGLRVDGPRRLAFVACERNDRLLVFDLGHRRVTGRFTVGDGPDVLALDPSLHRLYVASESGVVAVFAEQRRTLRKLAQGYLAPRAHSVAVDPATHLVYFPLENLDGRAVLWILRPSR